MIEAGDEYTILILLDLHDFYVFIIHLRNGS